MEKYTLENGNDIALNGVKENEMGIRRMEDLNQLGNSAVELAKAGNTLYSKELVQYAERRGARDIDLTSENRVVEKVDVMAAIKIGYAVAKGYLKYPTEIVESMQQQQEAEEK